MLAVLVQLLFFGDPKGNFPVWWAIKFCSILFYSLFLLGSIFRVRGIQGPPEPLIFVPFFSCYKDRRSAFKRKWVLYTLDSCVRQRLTPIWPTYEAEAWMNFWQADRRWGCLYRNAEASSVGPGLFLLPLPVLWSRVHAEFSDSPALPVHKVKTQKQSCVLYQL